MFNKQRGPAGPPLPPAPIAKTLKYNDASEAFVRRLGSAIVLHWDTLPDDLQDLLIDQAVLVEDRDPTAHAREDIEQFLRTAKSVSLKPAAKVEEPAD